MIVYVVTSVPKRGSGGVGALEWRYKEQDGLDEFARWKADFAPENDTVYHGAIEVPDGLGRDEITEWLDLTVDY